MSRQVLYDFAAAINLHDMEKIGSLMTDDHVFIDAHGNSIKGKDKMITGWASYFGWFPDYRIEITESFENGDTLAAFGFAEGTLKGLKTGSNEYCWRLPAAWKAVVSNGKIKLWQVYADTKIPFDIISKNS
jgi:ketosteroid isomerase-like protein